MASNNNDALSLQVPDVIPEVTVNEQDVYGLSPLSQDEETVNSQKSINSLSSQLEEIEAKIEQMMAEAKVIKLKIKQKTIQANSPTTTDTARKCVFVQGVYRQLHNFPAEHPTNPNGLYYRTDANTITPVKINRTSYENAFIRGRGGVIIDGKKGVSIHTKDVASGVPAGSLDV